MEAEQQADSSPKPLSDIFTRPDAPAESGSDDSPSPATETKTEETKVVEAAAPADDKKATAESESATSEVKAEAKTEETKTEDKAEAVGDAKSTIDWESDENPFKQKVSAIEKQYNDTRQWARQEAAQRQKLQQQLDVINKKLDGTYDPAVDDPRPDPQAVVLQAEAQGKMTGSLDAAYRQYGKEKVDTEIARYNELFENNAHVQQQVWTSPAPVFAALKVLREFDISQKYGTTDVTELIEKVKAEHEAGIEKKLIEKITKQVMDGISMKNKTPTGISGARAATKVDGEKPPTEKPLSAFFNN